MNGKNRRVVRIESRLANTGETSIEGFLRFVTPEELWWLTPALVKLLPEPLRTDYRDNERYEWLTICYDAPGRNMNFPLMLKLMLERWHTLEPQRCSAIFGELHSFLRQRRAGTP